jgi:tRNA-specific 2-thiouridylase
MLSGAVSAPKTIVVAMSGGVDSSTVAAMLHEQGHNVIGITLQLYDHGMVLQKKGACCAGQDIYDAKMVASKLGFPHYVLDYESTFRQSVIDDFVDSYTNGETPLPCVRCNQSVKFKDLLKVAKELGADALATGHYVRRIEADSGPELHCGVDKNKDQSYFLFSTTNQQLSYLQFPLGEFSKDETRSLAQKYGLEIANKPDSQDICFVPDGNYRDLIKKIKPDAAKSGKFVHVDGYELGEHEGIVGYTVGQRRGLGIAHGEPIYVTRIDPVTNTVYLGPESALLKSSFILKDVNWLGDSTPRDLEVKVKIRSASPGSLARITMRNDQTMEVSLFEREKAVTPGQACVLYDGSRVLGGGWITRDIS